MTDVSRVLTEKARRFGWFWAALILAACVGYQWLVYSAVRGEQTDSVRLALTLLPLLALAGWVMTRSRNKLLWFLVLLAAGVATFLLEREQRLGLAAAYGIPHAAIYLFLLWLFGHTLWRAKEPLITRLARQVHGTLPPEMVAYTRWVTFAWCVFFAAQLVISALLFEFASLNAWSLFISLLNFPLLVLMFVGEYAYRVTFHRDFPHASILEAIQSFSKYAARPRSAKGH
jgi:uncharacterized membrane protein